MQTAARINRLIIDEISFSELADLRTSSAGFYQLLSGVIQSTYTKQSLISTGGRLVTLAEQSHALRQMSVLEELAQVLIRLPLPKEFHAVGKYYLALCAQNQGRGNLEKAARLFERVLAEAPPWYRLRAMQSLGSNSIHKRDYKLALSFYNDARILASYNSFHDPYATIGTHKMIALTKSIEGNHRDAVRMLENLFPLAHSLRSVYPHVYYDYLNSFAVELGEAGRLEEAQNVSKIALASPYASAYPEWRETFDEIAIKRYKLSRSVAAITQKPSPPDNLVRLPVLQRSNDHQTSESRFASKSAQVSSLKEWKQKQMKKECQQPPQDNIAAQKIRRMSRDEKLCAIVRAIHADDAKDEMLDQLLEAVLQFRPVKSDEG